MNLLTALWQKVSRENALPVSEAELAQVRDFFTHYRDFRNVESCARVTGLPVETCARARALLYARRELGLYFFEAGVPPQRYMRRLILERFPFVGRDSRILEVGPGDNPLFPVSDYPNWHGVDKYVEDDFIRFREQVWGHGKYPAGSLSSGCWENLVDCMSASSAGTYDVVTGSHSFEHVFQPVAALRQARQMLRPGGVIFLFVPDGLSDDVNTKDPTHTLYLVPEMVRELFECAGGYRDLQVEVFRPNADLSLSAIAC